MACLRVVAVCGTESACSYRAFVSGLTSIFPTVGEYGCTLRSLPRAVHCWSQVALLREGVTIRRT
jgi:hypothetical protein